MEEEAEKLKQLQSEVDKQLSVPTSPNASLNMSFEEKMDVDNSSVYIGNVDYGATAEELEQHFHGCGSINRPSGFVRGLTAEKILDRRGGDEGYTHYIVKWKGTDEAQLVPVQEVEEQIPQLVIKYFKEVAQKWVEVTAVIRRACRDLEED